MDSCKSARDTLGKVFSKATNGRISFGANQGRTLTVLILGETGVGKSTWINGIANYVKHGSLTAALLGPKWLIPSRFIISDDEYNVHTIFVGNPDGTESEQTKVGESSTMFPQVYEFKWGNITVRFIDTPGIGDSRGLPQDKINLATIFRFVKEEHIEELNAVMVLIKPNQKVFTTAFKYCIGELFTHLPKSCTENLLFGFTGTRPHCYRPGETLEPLRLFLKPIEERQGVSLKVNKNTAFCFDNEAFRFLFASLPENGISFTEEERENYAASWKQSVKETQRFFKRVSELTPHNTTDMLALNEARQCISMLSKPLVLISEMIQLNIETTKKEMKRIESLDTADANFKQELMKQHKKVYYVCENLPKPRTVCTGRKCIEMVTDEYGTSQVHYIQHCHDGCDLDDVEPKAVGDKALMGCWIMDGDHCRKCGCHWTVHMHVTYKQTMRTEMVETVNEEVQRNLNESGDRRKAQEMVVGCLKSTLEEYKVEEKEMGTSAAKCGAFLKKNPIMSYNDAVEKYLELSIQQAEQTNDIEHVETLREWLKRYKQQKHYIETGVENGCTASEIKGLCERLFNLKHSGRYFKEMFECEKRGTEDRKNRSAGNQPSSSHGTE